MTVYFHRHEGEIIKSLLFVFLVLPAVIYVGVVSGLDAVEVEEEEPVIRKESLKVSTQCNNQ